MPLEVVSRRMQVVASADLQALTASSTVRRARPTLLAKQEQLCLATFVCCHVADRQRIADQYSECHF